MAVELGALIALGLAFGKLSRAYGRGARWLILGPIWLALLLALFETWSTSCRPPSKFAPYGVVRPSAAGECLGWGLAG